ncbi:MAG: hypothetical protein AAB425_06925, partial [Bdellovibrionota bacterium]
ASCFILGIWAGFLLARWMADTDRLAELERLENEGRVAISNPIAGEAVSAASPLPEARPDWRAGERNLESVITDADIERYLGAVEIPEFFAEARDSRPLGTRSPLFAQSSGKFEGKVDFIDGTHRSWDMTLEIGAGRMGALVIEAGRPIAMLSLAGSEIGKGFRRFSKGSRGFLVSVDDFSRFQLYRMVSKAAFIGNFYYQDAVGKYKIRARVFLERKP